MKYPEQEIPRFFCDAMLGRLAKWLRLAGYHAEYSPTMDDWQMLRHCSREDLLLLTRNRRVMERWQVGRGTVRALLVPGDRYDEQLVQLRDELGLPGGRSALCSVCNVELVYLSSEEAEGRVPDYVHRTQDRFHSCPACGRIYWPGTHWDRIGALLAP